MRKVMIWCFSLGFLAFAAAEALWLMVRSSLDDSSLWVLEPNIGNVIAILLVATTACCLGFLIKPFIPLGSLAFIAMGSGVFASIVATMVIVDIFGQSSNAWPIVIVVDCLIMTPVIGAGWLAGSILSLLASPFIGKQEDEYYRGKGNEA